jgi:hypothetical protein
MAAQALAHRRTGPKQEPGVIYRASSRAETAVRAWLAERVPLLTERVVAADVLLEGRREYERLYLELDAVEGSDGAPRRVFEIKFSSNVRTVRRGVAQLVRARHLLEQGFDRIATMLVLVEANRTGVDLEDTRVGTLGVVLPEDLSPVPSGGAASRQEREVTLMRLTTEHLAEHYGEGDMDLIERARDEGEVLTLARAERAAADPADAADAAEAAAREVVADAHADSTHTFGGDDDEPTSPFAALRGLSERSDDTAR